MMDALAKSSIADATTDFSRLDEADAILLCVPTPLDHHREPDMSYVEQTTKTVSKYLRKVQLVILESTTWPGTTEELMIPILEKNSGLKAAVDFYVAYSPEREDPGNPNFNTAKIPKVVGGYCISIDPFYLTWKAREFEKHTRFIELAGEVNTNMPTYLVDRTMHALNTYKKPKNGSKILMIGPAYKPDVDNMGESPALRIMNMLKKNGAEVSYYDPYLPTIPKNRDFAEWTGTTSVTWQESTISSFDATIISTNHSNINYAELAEWSSCVIDTRNAMNGLDPKGENHIFKA